ncbi:ribonuclease III domain-containing protein [Xylariaceae sp. FL0016]|nr:ribonuclease III domain-containing protein [Xylariaceae sp. FL0016]
MKTAVFAFQFLGCVYQPPAGDQTCLGYLGTSRALQAASRLPSAPLASQRRCQSTVAFEESPAHDPIHHATPTKTDTNGGTQLPSPYPNQAPRSAKLAALHARLSLPSKIPVQTLARALVDPSADEHSRFNNANLASIGASLLQYHTSEWLITRYPRLPMAILFAAMKGYAGGPALKQISRAWGVEEAAAPGGEVDPGLLQFSRDKPTVMMDRWGYVRAESKELQKYKWRRGMSSRILYDDAFGDTVDGLKRDDEDPEFSGGKNKHDVLVEDVKQNAHANFVRAVIGTIYLHCGRDVAKTFIKSHVLSRQLDFENLFEFKVPTRELLRLCQRENFDDPVARLLSETGRMSRTPVYVVGIYSGRDKLSEGVGSSLDTARVAAAINALKSWYLYSPGNDVRVPSDMLSEDAAPWKPAYVDIGEIIS